MVLLLEVARGLSALWVVLFHLKHLVIDSAPLLAKFCGYGYLGVAMFFVISGYVITYSAESTLKHGKSPLQFLRNRFLRIYPTFWASVAVVAAVPFIAAGLSALKSGQYEHPDTFLDWFNAADWINLLLLTQVFRAETWDLYRQFSPVNAVYWSLAIEFQFYLVIFCALYLGRFYRHFIAVLSISTVALMYLPNELNYGLFVHHWPLFAVGVIVAYLHKAEWRFDLGLKLSSIVLPSLYLLAVFGVYRILPIHYNSIPLAFALGVGGFLWFFANLEKPLQVLKGSKYFPLRLFLQFWLVLGAMSYSVYLLHSRIFVLPEMTFRQVLTPGGLLFALLTLLTTLALCYPMYYFVERRFLSKNYQRIHQQVLRRG